MPYTLPRVTSMCTMVIAGWFAALTFDLQYIPSCHLDWCYCVYACCRVCVWPCSWHWHSARAAVLPGSDPTHLVLVRSPPATFVNAPAAPWSEYTQSRLDSCSFRMFSRSASKHLCVSSGLLSQYPSKTSSESGEDNFETPGHNQLLVRTVQYSTQTDRKNIIY